MYKDSPDDLVFEMNYADSINGQYSKPIIGTQESVKGFTADEIRKYYKERYTKDNILIVVSGNFDKNEIIQKIDQYFSKLVDKKTDRRDKIDFSFNAGKKIVTKDINQVNICISHENEDYNSKNKIYTDILANIIGGSMSSRLFQEIREKNGLAYSVYTYNQYYLSGGLTSTYIGTNLENYEKAIEITLSEFKKLRENGVTEDELQKAKNKYMSRIAFAMENPRSRMGILGNYYIRKNEILDSEKMKNEVNAVKLEDVNNFAKTKYLTENITVLGNIK
jgi:zinc protease